MAQANRVYVRTATTGTGTATLGAVVTAAHNTFADAGVADGAEIRSYLFEEGNDFEIGVGIYNSAGPTLTRATVRLSRIAGVVGTTKMTLAGAATVRCISAKEDMVTKDTSGNVAIGTDVTADSPLTINANTAASVAPGATSLLHTIAADGAINASTYDCYGTGSQNITYHRRADGTLATKTAIASLQAIYNLQAQGWNGSAYVSGFIVAAFTAEAWAVGANGTYALIYTTAIGGVVGAKVRIHPSGGITLGAPPSSTDPGAGSLAASGSLSPGSFTVAGLPAGVTGPIVYCSNCRVFNGAGVQEGAGAGTGGMVSYNGAAWKIVGTNVTAVA